MTREEQIKEAADKFQREFMLKDKNNERFCFISGILWADKHPQASWISVEDRLPEDGVNVLVTSGSQEGVLYFHKGAWCGHNFDAVDGEEITHWMPFPELQRNVE